MSKFMGFDFHKDVNDDVEKTREAMYDSQATESFAKEHPEIPKDAIEKTALDLNTKYDMSLDDLLNAFFELAKNDDNAIGMSVHEAPSGMLAIPAMIMEVWKKAVEKKGEE